MKTEGAMKEVRGRARGWMLALGVLLGTLAAQAGDTVRALEVTTSPLSGAAGDTVVASVVDTGVRTGSRAFVILRLLDSNGAVVAETTGAVSAGVPLRLTYQATSSAALTAQVLAPLGMGDLSAPVLTLERWGIPVPGGPEPVSSIWSCGWRTNREPDPPPGPVLTCGCYQRITDIRLP